MEQEIIDMAKYMPLSELESLVNRLTNLLHAKRDIKELKHRLYPVNADDEEP